MQPAWSIRVELKFCFVFSEVRLFSQGAFETVVLFSRPKRLLHLASVNWISILPSAQTRNLGIFHTSFPLTLHVQYNHKLYQFLSKISWLCSCLLFLSQAVTISLGGTAIAFYVVCLHLVFPSPLVCPFMLQTGSFLECISFCVTPYFALRIKTKFLNKTKSLVYSGFCLPL